MSDPLLALFVLMQTRVTRPGRDRGDVPGWVLITIMTAGLVTAIWAVAKTQLEGILNTALNSVTSPGGGG